MKRSLFFLIAAIGAAGFGGLMFFAPAFAAQTLGIAASPETVSILRGMGGLIIGTATMSFLARRSEDAQFVQTVLITNIVTHAFGLAADFWGIADGALTAAGMLPVEATHLFVGVSSIIYLLRLKQ